MEPPRKKSKLAKKTIGVPTMHGSIAACFEMSAEKRLVIPDHIKKQLSVYSYHFLIKVCQENKINVLLRIDGRVVRAGHIPGTCSGTDQILVNTLSS